MVLKMKLVANGLQKISTKLVGKELERTIFLNFSRRLRNNSLSISEEQMSPLAMTVSTAEGGKNDKTLYGLFLAFNETREA